MQLSRPLALVHSLLLQVLMPTSYAHFRWDTYWHIASLNSTMEIRLQTYWRSVMRHAMRHGHNCLSSYECVTQVTRRHARTSGPTQ